MDENKALISCEHNENNGCNQRKSLTFGNVYPSRIPSNHLGGSRYVIVYRYCLH
jgi:hypothetical protein